MFFSAASYDTDNRYDRTDRSRRRMTDDDDTVLDNASVNSQDQGYTCFFHLIHDYIRSRVVREIT